ncbi:hypothetical protein [Selenomonas flueggei]|uniref:hypothetical protein n=1 Tax=Selenomonas flueggei TaxID=135080 RepID=UPI0026722178|nr:hypothetical protein [Selenomonas flueggei]
MTIETHRKAKFILDEISNVEDIQKALCTQTTYIVGNDVQGFLTDDFHRLISEACQAKLKELEAQFAAL